MCNCCCGVAINGKRQCRCRYGCVAGFAILEIIGGMAIMAFGAVDVIRNLPNAVRFLLAPEIWAGGFIMMMGFFGMCNGCCHHRGLGVAFILMSLMSLLLIGASFAVSLFTAVAFTVSGGYTCTYSCTKSGSNSTVNVNVNVVVAGISLLVFLLNIFGICCGCCTSCRCCGADADIIPTSLSHAFRNAENGQAAPIMVQPTSITPVGGAKETTGKKKWWAGKKNKVDPASDAVIPVENGIQMEAPTTTADTAGLIQ